jgi:hypothetical protein
MQFPTDGATLETPTKVMGLRKKCNKGVSLL